MRAPKLFWATATIGGVPALGLTLLWLTAQSAAVPTLLALLATVSSSLVLGAIWTADLEKLADTIRRASPEGSRRRVEAPRPTLPPLAEMDAGIERLARTLADRAAQVGALVRSNEAIVERLPDLLLVLGPDRAVRRANAAARAALGADMPAVVRHPGLRAAIDHAFAHGVSQVDLPLPVPVQREVQATVLLIDPPLADGGHAIVVLSDRTRERAVERMRADFVANASHELRTPLASLVGFIDTLRGPAKDDPPARERFLAIMAEQAERMNRLIDDLLSLSRIELTEHQAPSERVDVGAAAERIAAAFEPQVRARRVALDLSIQDHLPAVTADPDQIEQVMQNLVDNAVKYGREGGVVRLSVTVAHGPKWPARPGVLLCVADDGPGIPKAHVPRLTERFYRVDKGRSRGAGGTGLGLAIVRHIVNRHRGQLLIESEEGEGSTFSVWLPANPAPQPARAGGVGEFEQRVLD